jgi:NADH dehydrogenase FAD-containing subunit
MVEATKRVVAIGAGHCNCQVLKMLKATLPESVKLTIVNEGPKSYYSGMMPGTVSKLYPNKQLMIEVPPLATWCNADYVQKRVKEIVADENKVIMEDGEVLTYDVLCLNVGSRTRGAEDNQFMVKGVKEHSLTTRPINDILYKIEEKETALKKNGLIPEVIICGAGAAGTELSFGFKKRWSEVFG